MDVGLDIGLNVGLRRGRRCGQGIWTKTRGLDVELVRVEMAEQRVCLIFISNLPCVGFDSAVILWSMMRFVQPREIISPNVLISESPSSRQCPDRNIPGRPQSLVCRKSEGGDYKSAVCPWAERITRNWKSALIGASNIEG